jgi:protease I
MAQNLQGKRVAILVDNGFEEVEMTEPRKALQQAGAQTDLISPQADKVKGWNHTQWGDEFPVDVALDRANPQQYDAIMLPGGALNADKLRINPKAVQFVKAFFTTGKPAAAICHAAWMLVEIGAARGRTLTSWPSLQTDLRNAGANWVDQQVVVDHGLVTSRKPDDIPAFNQKMIEVFAEGVHEAQRAAVTHG